MRIVVDLDAVDIEPGAGLAEDEKVHHVPGVGAQGDRGRRRASGFPPASWRRTLMPPSSIPDLEVAAVVVAGGVLREQRLGPVQVGGAEPELDRALCQVETPARRQSRKKKKKHSRRRRPAPVPSRRSAGRRGLSRHRPATSAGKEAAPSNDHKATGASAATGDRDGVVAGPPVAPQHVGRPARRPAGRRPALRSTCRRRRCRSKHQVLGRRTRGRRRLRSRGGGVGDRRRRGRRRGRRRRGGRSNRATSSIAPSRKAVEVVGAAVAADVLAGAEGDRLGIAGAGVGKPEPALVRIGRRP